MHFVDVRGNETVVARERESERGSARRERCTSIRRERKATIRPAEDECNNEIVMLNICSNEDMQQRDAQYMQQRDQTGGRLMQQRDGQLLHEEPRTKQALVCVCMCVCVCVCVRARLRHV